MADLDFDELDKAVNNLMAGVDTSKRQPGRDDPEEKVVDLDANPPEASAEANVSPSYVVRSGKLSGKHFVVTGTLESMSRDEAADKVRALGGTFQTAVAKDTDYLVAGGKVGASKLKKAESYGTTIITEQEFLELIA